MSLTPAIIYHRKMPLVKCVFSRPEICLSFARSQLAFPAAYIQNSASSLNVVATNLENVKPGTLLYLGRFLTVSGKTNFI
jgi:hypothetical protein